MLWKTEVRGDGRMKVDNWEHEKYLNRKRKGEEKEKERQGR